MSFHPSERLLNTGLGLLTVSIFTHTLGLLLPELGIPDEYFNERYDAVSIGQGLEMNGLNMLYASGAIIAVMYVFEIGSRAVGDILAHHDKHE